MKSIFSSIIKVLGGLILVAIIVVAIALLTPRIANQVEPGSLNTAYPPPVSTPTQTNTPIPYPPPGRSDDQTATPIPTFPPAVTGTMPPPENWPRCWKRELKGGGWP